MKDVVYSMAAAKPLLWRGWGGLHLGSTGYVTDPNANIVQHVEYLPFGEVLLEDHTGNNYTNYLFNSKELDEESGFYYYSARYFDPKYVNSFLSRDPMEDKYPGISPYAYCLNNPLRFIDPTGMYVEPTTEGAQKEIDKYAQPKLPNGKKNPDYQPEFAKIYNEWKDRTDINVKFTTIDSKSSNGVVGTVKYEGEGTREGNNVSVYNVFWDPNTDITMKLGASGIFEEAFHLQDALSGGFDMKNNNEGFSMSNEVKAKQWVANNIKGIKESYTNGKEYRVPTHYGHFKEHPSLLTPENLANGTKVYGSNKQMGSLQPFILFGTNVKEYQNLLKGK